MAHHPRIYAEFRMTLRDHPKSLVLAPIKSAYFLIGPQ